MPPKGVEVDNLLSQFELATRKITVLERKVVEKDFKISVQQKAMQNYTDRLSKRERQICKLRKTNDSLKNDKIRLKKEITKLDKTTEVDIKKQIMQNSKIEPDDNCDNSGDYITVNRKKNEKKKNKICLKTKGRENVEKHHSSAVKSTTKHAKQRPKKSKTPADVNSTNQQRLKKQQTPDIGLEISHKTTIVTDSLGAGIRGRLRNKNTCVYVKRGATIMTIERVHQDLKYNQGYSESNRLVLLCGTNNLSCKSLGQTILAADELVDTATSLNPTADIHMIALPYRWDNPDLNDKIDAYNLIMHS